MAEANALIAVARSQIGYLEKKSNAKLEEFTANAGNKNFTKYNRDYIAPSSKRTSTTGPMTCATTPRCLFSKLNNLL